MKQTTILIFSKMINSAYGIFISWERNKVAQQMLIIFFINVVTYLSLQIKIKTALIHMYITFGSWKTRY